MRGSFTNDLKDDRKGPLIDVLFGHCKRYSLSLFIDPKHDELARFCLPGDTGGFHFQLADCPFSHNLFVNDFVQSSILLYVVEK